MFSVEINQKINSLTLPIEINQNKSKSTQPIMFADDQVSELDKRSDGDGSRAGFRNCWADSEKIKSVKVVN